MLSHTPECRQATQRGLALRAIGAPNLQQYDLVITLRNPFICYQAWLVNKKQLSTDQVVIHRWQGKQKKSPSQ